VSDCTRPVCVVHVISKSGHYVIRSNRKSNHDKLKSNPHQIMYFPIKFSNQKVYVYQITYDSTMI